MGTVSLHSVSADGHHVGLQDAVTIVISNVFDEVSLTFRGRPAEGEVREGVRWGWGCEKKR